MRSPNRAYRAHKIKQFKKQFMKCQVAQADTFNTDQVHAQFKDSMELYIPLKRRNGFEIARPPLKSIMARGNSIRKSSKVHHRKQSDKAKPKDDGLHQAVMRNNMDGNVLSMTPSPRRTKHVTLDLQPQIFEYEPYSRSSTSSSPSRLIDLAAYEYIYCPKPAAVNQHDATPHPKRSFPARSENSNRHITLDAAPGREKSRSPTEIVARSPEVRRRGWESVSTMNVDDEVENLGERLMRM